MLYIVLLAMVAGFLALRLYSVLGKRTGHEQPLPRPAEDRPKPVAVPRTLDIPSEPRDTAGALIDEKAQPGIRALVSADSGFDVMQFLDGAKSAYRMVLEAFWKGDKDTLDWLVGDDVKGAFTQAIEERKAAGHTLDNRLVSIENARIVEASIAGRDATVAVQFDADIAAVTRDADGNVIAGSMSDAVQTHDIWTFGRTLGSNDPNWKLIETDEA
ncbi:Tim44/TimA family putative adaptor protein [Stakelama sediminis]|uniref:Putative lipid-binding transport protein (Tim44 family) n=1 Tax=Stakelama sediminis TaxID=463200 RepID=A0A840YUN4_9SPHN|nr:putative lipid-binding transport protein (Tim44 family) [Stakelama sediminis]